MHRHLTHPGSMELKTKDYVTLNEHRVLPILLFLLLVLKKSYTNNIKLPFIITSQLTKTYSTSTAKKKSTIDAHIRNTYTKNPHKTMLP